MESGYASPNSLKVSLGIDTGFSVLKKKKRITAVINRAEAEHFRHLPLRDLVRYVLSRSGSGDSD